MKCRHQKCPLHGCPFKRDLMTRLARAKAIQSNLVRWRQRWMYESKFPFRKKLEYRQLKGTA